MKRGYPLRVWAAVNFLPPVLITTATLFIKDINEIGLGISAGLLSFSILTSLPLLGLNTILCPKIAASDLDIQTAKLYLLIASWLCIALTILGLYFIFPEFGTDGRSHLVFGYGILHSFAIVCFKLRR